MTSQLPARLATLAFAALTALTSFGANAQLKIGVIASATGPTAAVGIPQKNSAALLPKKIGNLDVEYTVLDDASDTTQTVTLLKKLMVEQKVDAIIGPSGSPNAMAALQFIAEARTPMLAPVGTTGSTNTCWLRARACWARAFGRAAIRPSSTAPSMVRPAWSGACPAWCGAGKAATSTSTRW